MSVIKMLGFLGHEANCKVCDSLLTFWCTIAIYYLVHYGSELKLDQSDQRGESPTL